MELKLKENIITVTPSVYRSVQEADISADMNLPDYCTDIAKMLKCTITPEITSKAIGGKRITVDGTAKINLIYCDTLGNIRAYCITQSYTKSFESDEPIEDGQLFVKISGERVNARPISPRKIDIHASFDIAVEVMVKKEISIISEATGLGTETEEIKFCAESHICSENKLIVLDETVDIGQGKPTVGEILKYDILPKLNEVKQISNKAVIKGEVFLKVLYSSLGEDSDTEELETSFQVSQIVDMPGADEDCISSCKLLLAASSVKARVDSSGDNRIISAEIIIEAQVECRKTVSFSMLADAYSTECEMNIEREEHSFKLPFDKFSDTEICRKNLELPTGDISEIKSIWCTPTVQSVSCNEDTVTVCGKVSVSIMGADDSNTPFFTERAVDFEYKHKVENKEENLFATADVSVINCGYVLKGGNCMELRAELEISGVIFSEFKRSVITSISLSEDSKIDKTELCGLTVYFASAGESVWEIAKKYSTAKKKIMEDNNLDSDILKKSGMLLISSK